jgi:hypothetical protein
MPRFHGTRWVLDGGIMAYSLVTQPFPLPWRNGGTCSSTAALQRTQVAPIRIKQEAGVLARKRGSILTGRSSSGARPSAREGVGEASITGAL